MTHQHGISSVSGDEMKDSSQHTASTSTAASPSSSQCCVYFAPPEWSRRYGEEFYTARITGSEKRTDGSHTYWIALRCADSEWRVEQQYSAFRQVLSDIAVSYTSQADGSGAFPSLPADKADVSDMQSWMDGTLQRKDISRLTAVRHFLNLDIPIQHTLHEHEQQHDDSEGEQATVEAEEGESKQTAAEQR